MEPDAITRGLLTSLPDPGRYGTSGDEAPFEAPGIARRLVPSNVSVLDVGVGVGGTTEFINRGKQNTVQCIEPDATRAALARQKGLEVYEGLFDGEFVATGRKFDVIVFGDVLEHMSDPAAAIRLAKQCLTSEGFIIASVPNVAHWTVRMSLLIGRFEYVEAGIMDATHLRWFTEKTLRALFQSEGFVVTQIAHSAGLWMPVYSSGLRRLVPYRIRKPVVLALLKLLPKLMAAQHIVVARPAAAVRAAS
jgi:SAM-dependent methyltransferase